MQKPSKQQINSLLTSTSTITPIQPFSTQSKLLRSQYSSRSTVNLKTDQNCKQIQTKKSKNSDEAQITGQIDKNSKESPIQINITLSDSLNEGNKKSGLSGSIVNEKEFSFANVQLETMTQSVHHAMIQQQNTNKSQQNFGVTAGQYSTAHTQAQNSQQQSQVQSIMGSRQGSLTARNMQKQEILENNIGLSEKKFNSPVSSKSQRLLHGTKNSNCKSGRKSMNKVSQSKTPRENLAQYDSNLQPVSDINSTALSNKQQAYKEKRKKNRSICRQVYLNLQSNKKQRTAEKEQISGINSMSLVGSQGNLNNIFKTPRESMLNSAKKDNSLNRQSSLIEFRERSPGYRLSKSPIPLRQEGKIHSPRENHVNDFKTTKNVKAPQNQKIYHKSNKSKNCKIMGDILNSTPISVSSKIGNVVQIDILTSKTTNSLGQQININTRNNQIETFDKENSLIQQNTIDLFTDTYFKKEDLSEIENINFISAQQQTYDNLVSRESSIQANGAISLKEENLTQNDSELIKTLETSTFNQNNQIDSSMNRSLSAVSLCQSNASKLRRTRKERLQEVNQIYLESNYNYTIQQVDFFSPQQSSKYQDCPDLTFQSQNQEVSQQQDDINIFDSNLNQTVEAPTPQQNAPLPEPLELKLQKITDSQQQNQEDLDFHNVNGYFSHRESTLLKTPKLINKSRQIRQKQYSSQSKDDTKYQISLLSANNSPLKKQETQPSIRNIRLNDLTLQNNNNMPLQLRQSKTEKKLLENPYNSVQPLITQNQNVKIDLIKEKTIIKKEINLKDLDDTDTFIHLEQSIKDQIKKKNELQKQAIQLQEQTQLNEKQKLLELQEEQLCQQINNDSIQKDNEVCQNNEIKERSLSPTHQKNISSKQSSMKFIKQKLEQSLKDGKFDLKLVRQLETEAAVVIQRRVRQRNMRQIKQLKDGKNMSEAKNVVYLANDEHGVCCKVKIELNSIINLTNHIL
eukprot:403344767